MRRLREKIFVVVGMNFEGNGRPFISLLISPQALSPLMFELQLGLVEVVRQHVVNQRFIIRETGYHP